MLYSLKPLKDRWKSFWQSFLVMKPLLHKSYRIIVDFLGFFFSLHCFNFMIRHFLLMSFTMNWTMTTFHRGHTFNNTIFHSINFFLFRLTTIASFRLTNSEVSAVFRYLFYFMIFDGWNSIPQTKIVAIVCLIWIFHGRSFLLQPISDKRKLIFPYKHKASPTKSDFIFFTLSLLSPVSIKNTTFLQPFEIVAFVIWNPVKSKTIADLVYWSELSLLW